MKRKSGPEPTMWLFLIVACIAFSGCQQIITTSLAAPLARESPPDPKIDSLETLQKLAPELKRHPLVAAACLDDIIALVNATSDAADRLRIKSLALGVAIEASGMGQVLARLLGPISAASSDKAAAFSIFQANLNYSKDCFDVVSYVVDISPSAAEQFLSGIFLTMCDFKAKNVDPANAALTDYSPVYLALMKDGEARLNTKFTKALLGLFGL